MQHPKPDAFCAYFSAAAEKNGVAALLTPERLERFYTLTLHMLDVNESFNLTAITEWERVILLHYIDCMMGARHIPEGATVIDVGCGAGFPSLPLAICRPDLSILALDATAKRVNYVKETADILGLSRFDTLVARAEDAAREPSLRERFDCATARAVAALPVLSELCLPFVKQGGVFAAMKGKSAREEVAAASHALAVLGGKKEIFDDTPLISPDGESFARATVLIRKEKRTPEGYPRPYAKICKRPL